MVMPGLKDDGDNEDEDDEFLFHYSVPSSSMSISSLSKLRSDINVPRGLALSKSTVYASNLNSSLMNFDLHTIFSTFVLVAQVTVVKDRHHHWSRCVAFILFISQDHTVATVNSMNEKILKGCTLSASITTDNGRATELFIVGFIEIIVGATSAESKAISPTSVP